MIIQNGYIEFAPDTAGGGLDPKTGYPVTSPVALGERIPCQYFPASQNLQARYQKENASMIEWSVLVEQQEGLPKKGVMARLTDKESQFVGTYAVREIIQLDAVLQVQLLLA